MPCLLLERSVIGRVIQEADEASIVNDNSLILKFAFAGVRLREAVRAESEGRGRPGAADIREQHTADREVRIWVHAVAVHRATTAGVLFRWLSN